MALTAATQEGWFRITRIQRTFVARQERQVLDWLCGKAPAWVTPDHLTVLGIGGAVLVFASYVASGDSPLWLWLASIGLVVHWLGDSLDGSLARHRRIERPIYGYFLDHTVDAICNLLIMAGLGLSPWVGMDFALFALVGYYLLCMYVFINNHVSGIFRLSFLGFGPTEIRLCLIVINIWMFFCGRSGFTYGTKLVSYYDLVLLAAGLAFTAVFVLRMLDGIRELRESNRGGTVAFPTAPPAQNTANQSVSRKSSSAAK